MFFSVYAAFILAASLVDCCIVKRWRSWCSPPDHQCEQTAKSNQATNSAVHDEKTIDSKKPAAVEAPAVNKDSSAVKITLQTETTPLRTPKIPPQNDSSAEQSEPKEHSNISPVFVDFGAHIDA